MQVHAEIEYRTSNEEHGEHTVHSDVCPPCCESDNMKTQEYREYLHQVLDEWLDKSGGTGVFYIAQDGYIKLNSPGE